MWETACSETQQLPSGWTLHYATIIEFRERLMVFIHTRRPTEVNANRHVADSRCWQMPPQLSSHLFCLAALTSPAIMHPALTSQTGYTWLPQWRRRAHAQAKATRRRRRRAGGIDVVTGALSSSAEILSAVDVRRSTHRSRQRDGDGPLNIPRVPALWEIWGWIRLVSHTRNKTRSSAVADTARRFVSVNNLLSHSRSFETTLLSRARVSPC